MHCKIFKEKYFKLLFLSLFIWSCSPGDNDHSFPTVNVDPHLKPVFATISEILTEMKVFRLETNAHNVIGWQSELVHLDENNIIFNSHKTILIFDKHGKFLNKIAALGKGPKEYTTILNTFVQPEQKLIYIVDYDDIKVYSYDGKYVETLKIPFSINGIYRKRNGQFIVNSQQIYKNKDRYMLHLLDSSLNLVHSFKSRNPDVCKDVQQNLFYALNPYEINDRLFYREQFVDTLFEVFDTHLQPHWSINMGDLGFETKDGIYTENFQKAAETKIPLITLLETEYYFFINYTYQRASYYSVFEKNDKTFIFHRKFLKDDMGIENDMIDAAPLFWPKYTRDTIAVSVVNPSSFNKTQLEAFNCKADDNPILFIGVLK